MMATDFGSIRRMNSSSCGLIMSFSWIRSAKLWVLIVPDDLRPRKRVEQRGQHKPGSQDTLKSEPRSGSDRVNLASRSSSIFTTTCALPSLNRNTVAHYLCLTIAWPPYLEPRVH